MKKFLAASIAATAFWGTSAIAADMPVKAANAPVAAAYDWTGFYIGANLGLGVGQNRFNQASAITDTTVPVTSFSGDSFRLGPQGWFGGGQIGYNAQFAPAWLVGIEADWAWSGQKDDVCVHGDCQFGIPVSQKLDWLATLRGRAGYAHDGWLWYATGGAAWGRVVTSVSFNGFPGSGTSDRVQVGWTGGAGVEVAIDGPWTAKLEYLYVDLGHTNLNLALASGSFTEALATSGEFHDHIVRAGLNYRLGGGRSAATMYNSAAVMPHNWGGAHVGVNVGYGQARNHSQDIFNPGAGPESFTLSPGGAIGGGQIGYNWQFARNWVAGVEADGQWSGQKDSLCVSSCNFVSQANAAGQALQIDERLNWFSTARGRIGYGQGDWLAYVTGGGAWGQFRENVLTNFGTTLTTNQLTHTKFGWTLGTGVETALSGPWSAKFEYLYVDLGTVTENYTVFLGANAIAQTVQTQFRDHIFRVGLNYKLGN